MKWDESYYQGRNKKESIKRLEHKLQSTDPQVDILHRQNVLNLNINNKKHDWIQYRSHRHTSRISNLPARAWPLRRPSIIIISPSGTGSRHRPILLLKIKCFCERSACSASSRATEMESLINATRQINGIQSFLRERRSSPRVSTHLSFKKTNCCQVPEKVGFRGNYLPPRLRPPACKTSALSGFWQRYSRKLGQIFSPLFTPFSAQVLSQQGWKMQ